MSASYGKTPLVFEENRGQTKDSSLKSIASTQRKRALLSLEIARVTLRTSNAKYNLSLTDKFRFPATVTGMSEQKPSEFQGDGY